MAQRHKLRPLSVSPPVYATSLLCSSTSFSALSGSLRKSDVMCTTLCTKETFMLCIRPAFILVLLKTIAQTPYPSLSSSHATSLFCKTDNFPQVLSRSFLHCSDDFLPVFSWWIIIRVGVSSSEFSVGSQ